MRTGTGIATSILALMSVTGLVAFVLGVVAGSGQWMVIAGATTLALAGATAVSRYRR